MLRALIVEDNPHFREIFKIVFHNKFPAFIVEEAGNGEEALKIINEVVPELISEGRSKSEAGGGVKL